MLFNVDVIYNSKLQEWVIFILTSDDTYYFLDFEYLKVEDDIEYLVNRCIQHTTLLENVLETQMFDATFFKNDKTVFSYRNLSLQDLENTLTLLQVSIIVD